MLHFVLLLIEQPPPTSLERNWSLPLYIFLGVGYLLLILFVSRAKKVRGTQTHYAPETNRPSVAADLISQINSVHVQQFLANTISVLEAFGACKDRMRSLPELNSAFPFRRFQEQILTERDLEIAIIDATKHTKISEKSINQYIRRARNEFRKLQGEPLRVGYFEKVDVRKIVHGIEKKHKKFNGFEILHLTALKEIFEREGLDVITLEELEVLSAIVEYKDNQGERTHAVLIKKGKDVHQALREFALAHEIGHWFAHLKNEQIQKNPDREFYLHSLHDLGPFENEANKIAMIALFPTPYLSWCDVFETLTAEHLFREFTKGMPAVGERLADNMREYIKRRIEGYNKYRQLQLQELKLPDKALTEAALKSLLDFWIGDASWARLDDNYVVVDANEQYASLFNLSKKELLDNKYNLIDDLTEESLRERTRQQLERKRTNKKPKFYFTKYKSPVNEEVIPVTIYAFPIVDEKGEYQGSFGVVTDKRGKDKD
jgi:PAS domain-containing protein